MYSGIQISGFAGRSVLPRFSFPVPDKVRSLPLHSGNRVGVQLSLECV